MRRAAFGVGLACALAQSPACAIALGVQNALLYHPDQPDRGSPEDFGLHARDLRVAASDGVHIHAWFFAASEPCGSLIYAHGNASNITDWRPIVKPLLDIGLNVMLFDYRGFGTSEGTPSEEGLYRDAEAALAATSAQPEAAGRPVYYYGQSLGGAVMAELAVRHEPTALVLQSTFTTLPEMARHVYRIPKAFVPGRFTTVEKVGRLHCPVLVIHGERDNFVPLSMGRQIYRSVPLGQRHLLLLPNASHNDVWRRDEEQVVAALRDLIRETTAQFGATSSKG